MLCQLTESRERPTFARMICAGEKPHERSARRRPLLLQHLLDRRVIFGARFETRDARRVLDAERDEHVQITINRMPCRAAVFDGRLRMKVGEEIKRASRTTRIESSGRA